jgi:hypothetical protein
VSCIEGEEKMDQHFSVALQVALFGASAAIIVLSVMLIRGMLRFEKQCVRIVTAVERVEAELAPLARNARVTLVHLNELSTSAQRAAEVAGELFLPVRALTQATRVVRAGIAGFLQGLLTGRA